MHDLALPIDLLDNHSTNVRLTIGDCVARLTDTEMLLHSTRIGHQCGKPTYKSQTTQHSTNSVLKLKSSTVPAPVRRGVLFTDHSYTGRLVQQGVPSAIQSTSGDENMDAESGSTNGFRCETDQEVADLAIVWAFQHGLVSHFFHNSRCGTATCCLLIGSHQYSNTSQTSDSSFTEKTQLHKTVVVGSM